MNKKLYVLQFKMPKRKKIEYSTKKCCGKFMIRKRSNNPIQHYIKCQVCGKEDYDDISIKKNINAERRQNELRRYYQ